MRLPSHSTVAAYAALTLAVGGGTAVAATTLQANSVGSREIKPRSVRLSDLHPSARPASRARVAQVVEEVITDPQLGLTIKVQGEKGAQGDPGAPGTQGAQGPQGPAGVEGLTEVTTQAVVAAGQTYLASATCPAGQKAVGGGARFTPPGETVIREAYPTGDSFTARVGGDPNSARTLVVTAICAQ